MASGPRPPDPGPPALQRDWTFVRSRPSLLGRLSRLKSRLTGRRPPPPHRALKPLAAAGPAGTPISPIARARLTPATFHDRRPCAALDGGLSSLCDTRAEDVPAELRTMADPFIGRALGVMIFPAYSNRAPGEIAALSSVRGRRRS